MSERATSEVLLVLLRAALGTGPPPSADELRRCEWPRLESIAAHHGVGSIALRCLASQGELAPADLLARLRRRYLRDALRAELARRLIGEIAGALGAHRVSFIALKGAALLPTIYADDPGLRPLTDVDLLVDERDVDTARVALTSIGLRVAPSDAAGERGPLCRIHAAYVGAKEWSVPVEVHWRLFEPYLPYCFDLAEVWRDARCLPGLPRNVFAMSAEHELAHLCIHLERHATAYRLLLGRADWLELLTAERAPGRLVWLYDIAACIRLRGPTLDWEHFASCARRWAIDARVGAVLELCRRALGAEPPPEVHRALDGPPPRFTERLAHRLVLASYGADEKSAAARLSRHAVRAANTWASLFPPAAYLRAEYPASSPLASRGAHLLRIVPGLWGEARERRRSREVRGAERIITAPR